MINAGAIATTGLITETPGAPHMARILEAFGRYTGHGMEIDEKVYRSESETGHRNRAIAHLLYGHGILDRTPEDILDLYFRQCSILVTARDLAVMGACLANNGVNPVTGVVALQSRYVEKVLSVMSTCGMYDYSGGWIFNVGMPAKSGVGGGIMAVLPGQLGLGVFSPPLDEKGNSFRGIEACKRLSSDFSLHLFHVARSTSASVIRHVYDCCRGMSRRRRNTGELAVLAIQGQRIRVYELQGELSFGGTESVTLDMLSALPELDFLVLDFKWVIAADQASILVIAELCRRVVAEGKRIFLTDCRQLYRLTKHLRKELADAQTPDCLHFEDADHAVEWCENQLLHDASLPPDTTGPGADLSQQYLCAGMGSAELDTLRALGMERRFPEGTHVFRQGDLAASMCFILEGEVEVWVDTDTSHHLRLTTLGAGMVFGEVALATQRRRTANVTAVANTRCLEVRFEHLNDALRTRMLMSMASYFAGKIEQDTQLIRHLA